PGTELAFSEEVKCAPTPFGFSSWRTKTVNFRTAIFRQVNKDMPRVHHDALEFPDGTYVLLTDLREGQEATVLQLPAQPKTPAEEAKHETRFVDLERVAGRNLGGATQINADSSGHARAPRRRPAADFTLPCRRRPNSRSPRPPTGDRRAALLVITVDLYLIPHAVYAIRIGTGKGVHGGTVLGVNHEYAAHGGLAVISNECARSHNVNIIVDGVIEMNAVGAIEFGPFGQHVRLVDGVNDEEHSRSLPDGS